MLQTAELLKKVRHLDIITRKVVDDVIGGAYHSVFKGRGIEFDEVREYTFEDDIRDIDWNVSARLNAPFVKKYIEERELTVLLMMDISGSMAFGAAGKRVCDRALEAAALLGLSAISNHDRVGLSLFSSRVDKFITPRGGRHHNLRLIRELVSAVENTPAGRTDIAAALRNACGILVKRSVIFIISDLLDNSGDLETALKIANRRHDVIVLHTYDPDCGNLPPAITTLYDSENGRVRRLFRRKKSFNEDFQRCMADKLAMCSRSGVEVIPLPSNADTAGALVDFFRRRKRRRHHKTPAGGMV